MKKILAFLVFVLVLASCEKEVKFNGKQMDPKLVLYCNAISGENLVADVSVSVFFLDRRNGNGDFTDTLDIKKGSVKVYVNGSETPYVMEYSPREPEYYYSYYDENGQLISEEQPPKTLTYSCGYVPKEGDHIKVVASFPGFDEVYGETDVPKNNIEIIDITTTASPDDYVRYEVTARVIDPGNMPLSYAVFPMLRQTSVDEEEGYFEYSLDINSSDVVFVNATDQLQALIDGDSGTSHYFSNDLIYGKSHEFKFTFDVNNWYFEDDEDDSYYTFSLSLSYQTLSESFYYHLSSLNQVQNSTFGLFGEGVTLYSNVKGGYGTVCASVSNSLSLSLK